METPVSGSTLFTDAMALAPAGDGHYDGELNEHWTIGPRGSGPKVHGGAMLALCANAARLEFSRGLERSDSGEGGSVESAWPVAISGNYLWGTGSRADARFDDGAQAWPPGEFDRRRAEASSPHHR